MKKENKSKQSSEKEQNKKNILKKKLEIAIPAINKFVQKFPRTEKTSPSLEKLNTEKIVNLEEGLANVRTTRKEKEDDEGFKYSDKKEKKEDTKYQNYNSQISGQYSLRENLENLDKPDFSQKREVGFVKLSEEVTKKSLESDYINVERFERSKLGKEDFSKKKEVKYEVRF